jgi:hypothetical protein
VRRSRCPGSCPRRWADNSADPERRDEAGQLVLEALLSHPTLPVDVLRTIRAALASLFGDDQWQRFNDLKPSISDLAALLRGLAAEWGVGLGEAWASSAPSPNGGATLKSTFNAGTASTPEESGLALATQGS